MMKRLFALMMAIGMLLSLAACGGKKDNNENIMDPSENNQAKVELKTFEMTCEPDGVDEPAKATVGYPANFTMEENDWCVILTDSEKDVEIEVYMTNDYNCYAENQEYAKEEYFFYEEGTFGSYEGYAYRMDEESSEVEVNVYLSLVAEMDDVYMTFRVSSASMDLDADPMAMFKLEEVQQVLNSIVYIAPAE